MASETQSFAADATLSQFSGPPSAVFAKEFTKTYLRQLVRRQLLETKFSPQSQRLPKHAFRTHSAFLVLVQVWRHRSLLLLRASHFMVSTVGSLKGVDIVALLLFSVSILLLDILAASVGMGDLVKPVSAFLEMCLRFSFEKLMLFATSY